MKNELKNATPTAFILSHKNIIYRNKNTAPRWKSFLLKSILTGSLCCLLLFQTKAQSGSLDLSFDLDGKVTTLMGASSSGNDMALQPDGKIVVVGDCSVQGGATIFSVARYLPNGTLDSTFDGDGKVTTLFGIYGDIATSVVIQPDGKIIAAGRSIDQGIFDFAMARYNPDGSLDNTFDGDGKVRTPIGIASDEGYAVALQPDGKILVGGLSVGNGSAADFALVRYNSNGSLDNTFDGDGKVTTDFGSTVDVANAMKLQPDGKIVLAGYTSDGLISEIALVRYNSNGSLDNTFDGDGKVVTSLSATGSSNIGAITLQPDGKLLATGYSENGSDFDLAILRYNSNGSLDNTFDSDGIVIKDVDNEINMAGAISLQSDGKILIAGTSGSSTQSFLLMRYQPSGTLDNSFNGSGIVKTSFGLGLAGASAMAIQLDGKIVLAGGKIESGVSSYALARYHAENASGLGYYVTGEGFTIYPNPFSQFTKLRVENELNNAELTVYNMFGQQVTKETGLMGKQVMLFRNNLPSGLYVVELKNNTEWISKQNVIITD